MNVDQYVQDLAAVKAFGSPAEIEAFFAKTLEGVDSIMCTGGSCPCAKPAEEIHQEVYDWMKDRLADQIRVRNDIICFYRESGRFEDCLPVFNQMIANIEEANLQGTPLEASILVNKAGMHMALNQFDEAIEVANQATAIFDKFEVDDPAMVNATYNMLSAAYAQKGDAEAAAAARAKADAVK